MNALFRPEPRAPREYVEEFLDAALGKGWVGWTWGDLRAAGATDEDLRDRLLDIFSEYSCMFHPDFGGWVMRAGGNPKFYAAPKGQRLDWVHGKPNLQGAALLTAVRELRGIWRPT